MRSPLSRIGDVSVHDRPIRGAKAAKKLRLVVYAETDGKHLSAIDFEGRVLWTRSPFADAHLEPYRVAEPRIVQIYAPLPWMLKAAKAKSGFAALQFESTQFGVVDLKTGTFLFLGQD